MRLLRLAVVLAALARLVPRITVILGVPDVGREVGDLGISSLGISAS